MGGEKDVRDVTPGDVERAFNLAARAMQRRFGASGTEEDIEAALSEFFAPILAEKERLGLVVAEVIDQEAKMRDMWASEMARALAAEAALAAERERADMATRQVIKQNERLAAIRAQGE